MTNPDQYRRAPIPADGRTIEAMRLALLDTPAGRAMTNAGDTRLYWMNESDAYMLMSPFINTTDDVLAKVEVGDAPFTAMSKFASKAAADVARWKARAEAAEAELGIASGQPHAPDAVEQLVQEGLLAAQQKHHAPR